MGILTVSCDHVGCSEIMALKDASRSVGSEQYHCKKHFNQQRLAELEFDFLHKLNWLKSTHIADLKKIRQDIRALKAAG